MEEKDIFKCKKLTVNELFWNNGKLNYKGEDLYIPIKGEDGKKYLLTFRSGLLVQVVEETDG